MLEKGRGRGAPAVDVTSPGCGPRSLAGAAWPQCSSWQPLAKDNHYTCGARSDHFVLVLNVGLLSSFLTNPSPSKGSSFGVFITTETY